MNAAAGLLRRRAMLRAAGRETSFAAWRRAAIAEPSTNHAADAATRSCISTAAPLGCGVARRIIDGSGRVWRVREAYRRDEMATISHPRDGEALIFVCDDPDVPAELRRAQRPLAALNNADLAQLLKCGC